MAYKVTKDEPMVSSSIDLTAEEFADLLSMCEDGIEYRYPADDPEEDENAADDLVQAKKYQRIERKLTTLHEYTPGQP